MATYAELHGIQGEPGWAGLSEQIVVAILVKATRLLDKATPSAAEVKWAQAALREPGSVLDELARYVVISNKDAPLSSILGATDAQVQTAVDSAVDTLVGV